MTKIDRRDFLLHVAPLIAAPALILGSVEEMEAQIKNFALRTPTNNAQLNVGQTVQISLATLKVAYPRTTRIDFKANNQIIGTTSNRPYQINWQPTQTGNFTLTAEAVLSNGTVVTTPSVNVAVASSQLEVLYDTLGSATDGWGWAGQGSYFCSVVAAITVSYSVATNYIGTLANPKRLRGFEIACQTFSRITSEPIPPSRFLGHMWLGIWRSDVGTFFQQPVAPTSVGVVGGSLTSLNLGTPITGSYETPAGMVAGRSVYVFGWDNLNILLPSGVELEMSFQLVEAVVFGDAGAVYGSSRPGPTMRQASSDFGNSIIGQPMATRIKVSS